MLNGVLPIVNIVASQWPALDIVPPTNGSEIQHWIQAVQAANIPKNPQTKDGSCESDPELVPNAGPNGTCWWTCGGCLRDTDISTCPTKLDWGVSYDDGPGDYTPQLINYLNDEQIKATFFTVRYSTIFVYSTFSSQTMLSGRFPCRLEAPDPPTRVHARPPGQWLDLPTKDKPPDLNL